LRLDFHRHLRRLTWVRYYWPAVVLSTIPGLTLSKVYGEWVPLDVLQIVRLAAALASLTAALSIGVHALAGSDKTKGAALALAVIVSGYYPVLAEGIGVRPASLLDTALGLLFIGGMVTLLHAMARRARDVLDSAFGILAVVAVVFLAYSGSRATVKGNGANGLREPGGTAPALAGIDHPPDIIHIIFDGLGSLDRLQSGYGLDATGTGEMLSKAGMRITTGARANYSQTFLAAASMLSMEYLDDAERLGRGGMDRTIVAAIIDNGAVIRALKSRGYTFTLLSSGYEALAKHPLADDGIDGPKLFNQFESFALPRTMLRILPIERLTFEPHRRRTRALLQALENFQPGERPRYVLVHLMLPHPPFVFSENGSPTTPSGIFTIQDASMFPGTPEEYRLGYAAQAKHSFTRIARLLDKWRRLPHPPIVIVNGDHGPGLGFDFAAPLKGNVEDRLRIFLGVHADRWPIDDIGSPVNIYRHIFNAVFETRLDILPDRSFVSAWALPYDVTEVVAPKKAAGRQGVTR
jgi:hypothetical protein